MAGAFPVLAGSASSQQTFEAWQARECCCQERRRAEDSTIE